MLSKHVSQWRNFLCLSTIWNIIISISRGDSLIYERALVTLYDSFCRLTSYIGILGVRLDNALCVTRHISVYRLLFFFFCGLRLYLKCRDHIMMCNDDDAIIMWKWIKNASCESTQKKKQGWQNSIFFKVYFNDKNRFLPVLSGRKPEKLILFY